MFIIRKISGTTVEELEKVESRLKADIESEIIEKIRRSENFFVSFKRARTLLPELVRGRYGESNEPTH